MTNDNYESLSKEELIKEIERLKNEIKKKKKYGLVWEEKPEDVVEQCKKELPVLKEIKEREIITDKDKPVNLLIEGDNYHALSVLNYTHAKKVDVIYIDPPYNTGNKDFIFNDHYVDKEDAYRHSKWLAFMEKRLKLARNLLKDTGVIFISIDDNEVAQLKLLMDEIWDPKNYLRIINIRKKQAAGVGQDALILDTTEYVIAWAKNKNILDKIREKQYIEFPIDEKIMDDYSLLVKNFGPRTLFKVIEDARGNKVKIFQYRDIQISRINSENKNLPFFLKNFDRLFLTYNPQSSLMRKVIQNLPNNNFYEIEYIPTRGKNVGEVTNVNFFNKRIVQWLNNIAYIKDEKIIKRQSLENFWTDISYDTLGLQGNIDFKSGKKPLDLIKRLVNIGSLDNKTSIILDFFAGSGTTGEAVLELNKEDGGNRKFILCTDNENNICTDICYPRIKYAIFGYRNKPGLRGNLKYFKTDFVDYDEPTDKNKIKLTKQATEMLCIKEGTFEKVIDNEKFKIFKNSDHYTGIIWDQTTIPVFKEAIKDIKSKFSVYVFSLGDETFDEEFEDVKQKIQLSPIPEAILRVYRRIFK